MANNFGNITRSLLVLAGCVLLTLGSGSGPRAAPSPAWQMGPASTADTPTQKPVAPVRALPAFHGEPGVAVGVHGAVASEEANATRIGLQVLKEGGNAVDAAIAIAFVLSVTHPSAGNVGGGGFMLVRLANGTATAIDYRETAPGAASRDMYLDASGDVTKDSVLGARSAGIPGTVAGLALAHARFSSRPWRDLVMPAVLLAEHGYVLDGMHARDMAAAVETMRAAGFKDSARYYTGADGAPLPAGATFVQPELGATLRTIAEKGAREFYEGPLADALVAGVKQLGGLWSADDLRGYQAKERAPIVFDYRGHRVLSMPPPSSGGIALAQILAGSALMSMEQAPFGSADATHLYVEVARRAFADRSNALGDPDFVDVPTQRLLDPAYLARRMNGIDRKHATPSAQVAPGVTAAPEHEHTTHFSVVDDLGNAIANTYTLNTGFGAKVVVPGTGVLLNDEMDDFAAKPGVPNVYGLVQGEHNAIAPHKRMLSSMTPTIVEKDGQLRAVIGSPGGPTIINTVAEIVRALIDYGQPLDVAVRAPRVHHQWMPDEVMLEPAVPQDIEDELRARGHATLRRGTIGHANCIEVDPTTQGLRAVADVTRGGGAAAAY